MLDPRTSSGIGKHPGARYRCRLCQRFVVATGHGVCPSCGMAPPTFTPVRARTPAVLPLPRSHTAARFRRRLGAGLTSAALLWLLLRWL